MAEITLNEKLMNNFNELTNKGFIKQFFIREGFSNTSLYVTFESLNKEDYPHNIAENGKYVRFKIDLSAKKVELHSNGHIWLNKADKESEKYKYYAMRSMVSIAEEKGIKKFRKSKFTDAKSLFDKMNNYFQNVMEHVNIYSGGYPYNTPNY